MSSYDEVKRSLGIFQGLRIMILQTFLGRKRITLFESQISKEGGILCSLPDVKSGKIDPAYVVVEDSLLQDPFQLEKLTKGVIDLSKTFVGTRWLSDSIKQRRCLLTNDYELKHKPPSTSNSMEPSVICNSSLPKKLKLNSELSKDIDANSGTHSKILVDADKFVCSQSSLSASDTIEENQRIIQELQKLADTFRSKGDTWRTHGYVKAISAIKKCRSIISSYEDAVSLPGVGDKIATKVWEIIETGSLRKVKEVCEDAKSQSLKLFTNIWGVGPNTAETWYQQGCRSLSDLEGKVSLSNQQQIGLKHYDDFLERIPRREVEEVGQLVSFALKSIDPSLCSSLVGSYRRGKDSCGDIDVMIIKPDYLKSKDILSELLATLKASGLVTDDLVSMGKEGNQRKYLGVCCLPGEKNKHRRLDIFVVPKSESATALMHYTGSALFNRSIRLLAAKKGMSLSEHSLHAGIVREGLKVLNEGYAVPTPTEESIFQALDLTYRIPEERDH